MASREETNFTRLLHRCEVMAAGDKHDDWRLEKYITTLQDYLQKLRTLSTNRPSTEHLADYTRKVDFLKGLMEAEKLESSSARVLAADLLTSGLKSSESGTASKELHLHVKTRYQRDQRQELLSNGQAAGGQDDGLRQRHAVAPPGEASGQEEDLDTILRHQQELQEKLAEEMVYLTRNLKEHASAAGRMVRDDTKRLDDSNKMADVNYGKLKVESERLEHHVKKSCNWWMWFMLAAVCLTFIWMVVFMRMFPKR